MIRNSLIVVTEYYDSPLGEAYFPNQEMYGEYLNKFFSRPLESRLLAKTFTAVPHFT